MSTATEERIRACLIREGICGEEAAARFAVVLSEEIERGDEGKVTEDRLSSAIAELNVSIERLAREFAERDAERAREFTAFISECQELERQRDERERQRDERERERDATWGERERQRDERERDRDATWGEREGQRDEREREREATWGEREGQRDERERDRDAKWDERERERDAKWDERERQRDERERQRDERERERDAQWDERERERDERDARHRSWTLVVVGLGFAAVSTVSGLVAAFT